MRVGHTVTAQSTAICIVIHVADLCSRKLKLKCQRENKQLCKPGIDECGNCLPGYISKGTQCEGACWFAWMFCYSFVDDNVLWDFTSFCRTWWTHILLTTRIHVFSYVQQRVVKKRGGSVYERIAIVVIQKAKKVHVEIALTTIYQALEVIVKVLVWRGLSQFRFLLRLRESTSARDPKEYNCRTPSEEWSINWMQKWVCLQTTSNKLTETTSCWSVPPPTLALTPSEWLGTTYFTSKRNRFIFHFKIQHIPSNNTPPPQQQKGKRVWKGQLLDCPCQNGVQNWWRTCWMV